MKETEKKEVEAEIEKKASCEVSDKAIEGVSGGLDNATSRKSMNSNEKMSLIFSNEPSLNKNDKLSLSSSRGSKDAESRIRR